MAQKTIQKTKVKNRPKAEQKIVICKQESIYCSQIGCGHAYTQHYYGGCRFMTEGTECEDHWRCKCECIQCIHKNQHELEELQKQLDLDGQP